MTFPGISLFAEIFLIQNEVLACFFYVKSMTMKASTMILHRNSKKLEQGVDESNSDDINHVMLNINTIESIDDG